MRIDRSQTIQQIMDGFGQLKRAMRTYHHDMFAQADLSLAQLDLLMTLQHMQPVSHKALAASLQLTAGAVSQMLDGLDKRGYITRSASSDDRRIIYVSISTSGERMLERLQSVRHKLFTTAFDSLGDAELAAYLQTQRKLVSWLEQNQPKQ